MQQLSLYTANTGEVTERFHSGCLQVLSGHSLQGFLALEYTPQVTLRDHCNGRPSGNIHFVWQKDIWCVIFAQFHYMVLVRGSPWSTIVWVTMVWGHHGVRLPCSEIAMARDHHDLGFTMVLPPLWSSCKTKCLPTHLSLLIPQWPFSSL